MAICARWVDSKYTLQKALLAMPECRYSHSGEKQAHLLFETLVAYGILPLLGFHTGDNATSNDTCLRALSRLISQATEVNFLTIYS
jgi:hypothetical protein